MIGYSSRVQQYQSMCFYRKIGERRSLELHAHCGEQTTWKYGGIKVAVPISSERGFIHFDPSHDGGPLPENRTVSLLD